MKRKITEQLVKWRLSDVHKPLILQGVRQCGKTYTICEFGKEYFKQCLYFNFERESQLAAIFDYDYDCARILRELAMTRHIDNIDLQNTLIILDEISKVKTPPV